MSLAINAFVFSVVLYIYMYLEVSIAEAILSLAINAFVFSVVSYIYMYLEVSSRGYLVASDKCVCLLCIIVFRGETSCIRRLV